jgi:homoserine dehydrogenase
MFVGQGAGSLPTAHAVVQDMLDIYQDQDSMAVETERKPVRNDAVCAQFYIRTAKPEAFADVCERKDSDTALLTVKMPLSRLLELMKGCGDEHVFAAMVME